MFQRTPNYAVPAHNAPLEPEYVRAVKADYPALRARARQTMTGIDFDYSDAVALETPPEERTREYERRWQRGGLSFLGAYKDLMVDQEANDTAAEFVRAKIRERVRDPEGGRAAGAQEHHRLQAAVHRHRLLRDVQPAERHADRCERRADRGDHAAGRQGRRPGVRGRRHRVRHRLRRHDRARCSRSTSAAGAACALREKWSDGPRTYLGLAMAGFPNLFTITGPGSPSVLTNMLPTIEQHVDWIADSLGHMRGARPGAHRGQRRRPRRTGSAHVGELAGRTLRYTCGSWYLGANIPGKPRVFMPYIGGFPEYVAEMQRGRGQRLRGLSS